MEWTILDMKGVWFFTVKSNQHTPNKSRAVLRLGFVVVIRVRKALCLVYVRVQLVPRTHQDVRKGPIRICRRCGSMQFPRPQVRLVFGFEHVRAHAHSKGNQHLGGISEIERWKTQEDALHPQPRHLVSFGEEYEREHS